MHTRRPPLLFILSPLAPGGASSCDPSVRAEERQVAQILKRIHLVNLKSVADRFLQIQTAMFARRDLMHGALGNFILFVMSQLLSLKLNLQ